MKTATNREQQALDALKKRIEALPGHLGFYYKNLITKTTADYRSDEPFLAASVIKFPLFLYILKEAAAGRLDLAYCIKITEAEKVPVCGALTLYTDEPEVDIRTLCRLMISISDNTATNALLRYCGIDRVNEGFRAMGLSKTHVERFLFDSAAGAAGRENYIAPLEMGALLEMLYCKEFVSETVSQEALDTLLLQQINHKLDGKLCGAIPIAHKTGEDDGLSNDVGILYARQPFLLCFAGHDTDVYSWETLIRESAYDLYMAQV